LFLGRSDGGAPITDSFDWWWVSLADGKVVKVGLFSDAALRAAEPSPSPSAWSSDGVLFSDSRDLWSVVVSMADGRMRGRPQRLTVSTGAYIAPNAAASGRIVFASTQNVRVFERAGPVKPATGRSWYSSGRRRMASRSGPGTCERGASS
jgi:hypothetical protein